MQPDNATVKKNDFKTHLDTKKTTENGSHIFQILLLSLSFRMPSIST